MSDANNNQALTPASTSAESAVSFINQSVLQCNSKPLTGMAKPMAEQAAAMMVEDMRSFLQGTEQVLTIALAKAAAEVVAGKPNAPQALKALEGVLKELPEFAQGISTSVGKITDSFNGAQPASAPTSKPAPGQSGQEPPQSANNNATDAKPAQPANNDIGTKPAQSSANGTETKPPQPADNDSNAEPAQPANNDTETKASQPDSNNTETQASQPAGNNTETQASQPDSNNTETQASQPASNDTNTETSPPSNDDTDTEPPQASSNGTDTKPAGKKFSLFGQRSKSNNTVET